MGKRIAIISVLALFITGFYFISQKDSPALNFDEPPFTIKKKKKAQRIAEALEENALKTQDPALGYPPSERLLDVFNIIKQKREQASISRTTSGLSDVKWTERGPYSVGGRTRAILIDQNDPTQKTVFSASVSGGLWKTSSIHRNPPNWEPVNDNFQNLAICALAQSPTDPQIIYFGTGEGYGSNGFVRGIGIWKSSNGGETWTHLQSTNNPDFNYTLRILIHPNGDVYAVTLNGGLKRSQDGGQTWTTVLGQGVNGGLSNMTDIDISSDGTLFASGGHGSSNGTVWRSDAGPDVGSTGTWQRKTNGFASGLNRIEIATSPSNENVIYAVSTIGLTSNSVYKSSNRGETWEPKPLPQGGFAAGQGWYNLCIAVDPNNPNRLIIGALNQFMSTDGGNTWTIISQNVHVDQHFILYEKDNSNVVYFGNDGGIYRSTNAQVGPGSINFTNRNDRYNVTQYYACAIHPDLYSNTFLAGSQDNGTQTFSQKGLGRTTDAFGADGAYCHIDQNEPEIQIISWQNGNYLLSNDGGATFNAGGVTIGSGFINDSDYDDEANILYAYGGGGIVYRWDITQTSGEFVPIATSGGFFRHYSASPNVDNRIYIGSTAGQIIRIDDADTSATLSGTIISNGLPNGYISCIAIEKGNEDHLLATISNYGLNSVWETSNGGANWSSVEGNLPDMPVRWGIFNPTDPSQAFIATEAGVWSTELLDGGNTVWEPNLSMPSVRTDMLKFRDSDNLIVAATHGRGLWTMDGFSPPKVDLTVDQVSYILADQQFTDQSINPDGWLWNFGDGNTSVEQNPRHSYEDIGTYDVSLTINGSLTTDDKVKILPNRGTPYDLNSGNYGGNFETQGEDFGVNTTSGSSFQRGNSTQAGKAGTHSGANAWVVGLNDATYEHNTETMLYTPNFDLSAPGIYEFSFWARFQIQQGFDGFQVQYSLDKGNSWDVLGRRSDTWYNYSNGNAGVETSFPNGSVYFTGNTAGTQFRKYKTDLSDLAGNENVAFRIVFRTDGSVRYAGLAIDDIQVSALKNVELATNVIKFNGEYISSKIVALNWVTSPEYRCEGFEIEHSINGRDFKKIADLGFIDAQGYSIEEVGYVEEPDQEFKLDVNYYRIKVFDFDDEFFYTDLLTLRRDESESPEIVGIFPNPFTDKINVSFDRDISEEAVSVQIFDALGRLVMEKKNIQVADVHFNLDIPNLSRGVYVMRLWLGEVKYSQKITRK